MQKNNSGRRIGYLLGLLLLAVALFAVMAFSASAVDIGSTADLLKYTGGGSYIDENGETQTVTETETVATTETFYITNDFDLTATATITLSGNYTFQSKQDSTKDGTEIYTITRTNGDFPMFTYTANFYIQEIILDGNNVEGTADGGALYGATGGATLYIRGNTTFKNLKAAKGGAICIVDAGWTYIHFLNKNNVFESCYASGNGGAIWTACYITDKDAAGDVKFINNKAPDGSGGAICIQSTNADDAQEGLVLQHGYFEGNSAKNGGAIALVLNGTHRTNIARATIKTNTATEQGGGIYISGAEAAIGVRNESFNPEAAADEDFTVVLSGNTSKVGGAIATNKKITINDAVLISGNSVSGGSGGGLAMQYAGSKVTSEIYGAKIYNNTASGTGGGVYVNQMSLKIDGAYITGNLSWSTGGGVYLSTNSWGPCTLTLESGTISGNCGHSQGGGIALQGKYNSSNPAVSHAVLIMNGGNIAKNKTTNQGGVGGAGIYAVGSVIEMNDGTISGNTSVTNGGGVYLVDIAGSETVDIDSEFVMLGGEISGNTATTEGAAVYVGTDSAAYLLGGEISGHTGTVATFAKAETIDGIFLGGSASYTTERGTMNYTSNKSVVIKNNNTTLPSATVLLNDLVEGSSVVFADSETAFLTVDANYTNISDATLDAIQLEGAHALYNPTVASGALIWPTEEPYQVIKQAGLGDSVYFRVMFAYRNKAEKGDLPTAAYHGNAVEAQENDSAYFFEVPMIPREIIDPVVVTFGTADTDYKLSEYLTELTSHSDDKVKNVATALLNYASAAQVYTNYNIGTLANPSYVASTTPVTSESTIGGVAAVMKHTYPNGGQKCSATFHSVRVSLDSKVAIKILITDWDHTKEVTVTVNGSSASATVHESASYAVLTIDGISAAELSNVFTVEMTDKDGGSSKLEYNLLKYILEMENTERDSETGATDAVRYLTRALYAYAVAANAYAN